MSTPTTTEEARELARRWTVNRACDYESDAGVGCDEDRDGYPELDETESERLFAWVRTRFTELLDDAPYMANDERVKGWLLSHAAFELRLSLVDGEALCESIGWPS